PRTPLMPAIMDSATDVATTKIDASERLIFALDVPTVKEAMGLVEQLDGLVSFFKVGLELYTAQGLGIIHDLVDAKKRVFLDLKYFDVPETVQSAVEAVVQMGVEFLTIHGNGKIVRAAVQGRGSAPLHLLSVTALTSLDDDDMNDLGLTCSVKDLVLYRAKKALEAGCDGVITSPEESSSVRQLAKMLGKDQFLIVNPGIRPQTFSRDDHKRLGTPSKAIKAGADYLVIGRPIRTSSNPRVSAEAIVREMQDAFDSL
ncbi:MAG: orotidine-5'-phosphate decarboxylase, partial [Candidatus Sulfotelmatobacter sp.]